MTAPSLPKPPNCPAIGATSDIWRHCLRESNAQSPDRNESLDQAPHKSSDLNQGFTEESAMRFARNWLLAVPMAALLAGAPARAGGTLTVAQAQDPNNWDPIATFMIP